MTEKKDYNKSNVSFCESLVSCTSTLISIPLSIFFISFCFERFSRGCLEGVEWTETTSKQFSSQKWSFFFGVLFCFDFKLNDGGSFEFWSEKFNFWFGWHKVDFFSKLGWWLGFGWSKIDSWQKVWSHGLKFDLLCFCFSIWDSWSVSSSKISVLHWWLGWFSQNL